MYRIAQVVIGILMLVTTADLNRDLANAVINGISRWFRALAITVVPATRQIEDDRVLQPPTASLVPQIGH
jgi:hypothetical protein